MSGSIDWAAADLAEITVDDVDAYTAGRLSADDDETKRMLDAALAAARRDVGWHVSPVRVDDVMVLDGPGWYQHKLRIPTQKIAYLTEVVDDGVTLDLATDVKQSAQVPWLLVRHHGHWSHKPSGITVTLDHGFTPAEAADWRQAILSLVDQMATVVSVGRADTELVQKQVDDVTYRWGTAPMLPAIEPILAKYRLLFGWV